jgi:DNA-directed RNA polymerase subunit RPC12/RpoP
MPFAGAMSGGDSAHVHMRIECPECHKKMLLQIALTLETANNAVECPNCHHIMIPLVPGPIVDGPFALDAASSNGRRNTF